MKGRWFIYVLILISGFSYSQNYRLGSIPSFNFSYKVSSLKFALKLEARQIAIEKDYGKTISNSIYNERYDMAFLVSKKISYNTSLTAGYQYRFKRGEELQRFIEQFSWITDFSKLKVAHRISADQTFKNFNNIRWRFRYRFGGAVALNGNVVDPHEFYFKYNLEHLSILENKVYDIETRLAPYLGYEINKNSKVEIGLDYRMDEILHSITRHNYWWRVNWYTKF